MNVSNSRSPESSVAPLLSRWGPWLLAGLLVLWLGRGLRRSFWSLFGLAMGMYWMFHG